jgi:acyl carrier protein
MSTDMTQVVDPEKMREFVADVLDIETEDLTDDANFISELGVDSLKALEVLVALEREYTIKLSEEALKEITCFADVRELVYAKLEGQ